MNFLSDPENREEKNGGTFRSHFLPAGLEERLSDQLSKKVRLNHPNALYIFFKPITCSVRVCGVVTVYVTMCLCVSLSCAYVMCVKLCCVLSCCATAEAV